MGHLRAALSSAAYGRQLTITEAITTVSERHITGDEYDLLREDLTDDQLAALVHAATM